MFVAKSSPIINSSKTKVPITKDNGKMANRMAKVKYSRAVVTTSVVNSKMVKQIVNKDCLLPQMDHIIVVVSKIACSKVKVNMFIHIIQQHIQVYGVKTNHKVQENKHFQMEVLMKVGL